MYVKIRGFCTRINKTNYKISTNSMFYHKILLREINKSEGEIYNETIKIIYIADFNMNNYGFIFNPNQHLYGYDRINKESVIFVNSNNDLQKVRLFISNVISEKLDLEHNQFILHATGFCYQDEGVLLLGNKHSGKSSLALGSILWHDAKLINDDFSFCSILDNTFKCFHIFNGIHISSGMHNYYIKGFNTSDDNYSIELKKNRIYLTSNNCVDHHSINTFIFPIIDCTVEDYEICSVKKTELYNLFMECFISLSVSNQESCKNVVKQILKYIFNNACNVYKIRFGKNIYNNTQVIKDIAQKGFIGTSH